MNTNTNGDAPCIDRAPDNIPDHKPLQLLTPQQAAQILNVSEATLAKDRMRTTPRVPYYKNNHIVRYRLDSLMAHIAARTIG